MLTIKPTHEEEVVLRSLEAKLTRATYKHFEKIFNRKKIQQHKNSSALQFSKNKFETIVSAIDEELTYLPNKKDSTVRSARKCYGRAKGGIIIMVLIFIAIPAFCFFLAQSDYLNKQTIINGMYIVAIAAIIGLATTRVYFRKFKGKKDREGCMTNDITTLQEIKDSCMKLS